MKYQKNKSGMIDKVKRSFLRMTSPFEFGASRKSDSLAFMNFPPEMAQRDAAYCCALKLLKVNMFSHTDEERRGIYSLAEALIGISLEKAEKIYRAGRNERRPLEYLEMIRFMTLVRNLLGTLSDLADYQYYIDQSEDGIAGFFGNKVINNFKISDGTFSNSEIGIYNLLIGMLDDAESTILASQAADPEAFDEIGNGALRGKLMPPISRFLKNWTRKIRVSPPEDSLFRVKTSLFPFFSCF